MFAEVDGQGVMPELEDDRKRWGGEMTGDGVKAELDGTMDSEEGRRADGQKMDVYEAPG